jgi:hypothetical protein
MLSSLLHRVQQQATAQLQQAATLPANVCFRFDAAQEGSGACEAGSVGMVGNVQKTIRRTVVSRQHGSFRACETVRLPGADGSHATCRSAQLAEVVAPGARYGFDLIAEVGVETYVRGRSLQDLQETLASQQPALHIPLSTLWDQQQKFLFYLGYLHIQSAPRLVDHLAAEGTVCWLLDGTCEPGTPVFFGIYEAASGLLLSGRKIPSEHLDNIRPCLEDTALRYGRPDRVLHDLSAAMSGACEVALPGVPHSVCHYHLARDVGNDLYAAPQAALGRRQRQLKLQIRLREQRRAQHDWFRQPGETPVPLVLSRLLAGMPLEVSFDDRLGREALLALHYWILDFRSDGRRRGFPFDPYVLYLHRRLVRAGQAVDRLLSDAVVTQHAPRALLNFQQVLQQYQADPQIKAAAGLYERNAAMFARLREALRLSAHHMEHLREPLVLSASAQQELQTHLAELRCDLRRQSADPDDVDRPLAQVVLQHLDKYWSHLVPDHLPQEGGYCERTTNKLERQWGQLKRGRRQSHGRSILTRDFQSLPEEYLLVSNLENQIYLDLVLDGSLHNLPAKLALASQGAGTFDAWRRRSCPRPIGQIPRRQLRDTEFLEHLVVACHDHAAPTLNRVA